MRKLSSRFIMRSYNGGGVSLLLVFLLFVEQNAVIWRAVLSLMYKLAASCLSSVGWTNAAIWRVVSSFMYIVFNIGGLKSL